jgi:hypothetical protein
MHISRSLAPPTTESSSRVLPFRNTGFPFALQSFVHGTIDNNEALVGILHAKRIHLRSRNRRQVPLHFNPILSIDKKIRCVEPSSAVEGSRFVFPRHIHSVKHSSDIRFPSTSEVVVSDIGALPPYAVKAEAGPRLDLRAHALGRAKHTLSDQCGDSAVQFATRHARNHYRGAASLCHKNIATICGTESAGTVTPLHCMNEHTSPDDERFTTLLTGAFSVCGSLFLASTDVRTEPNTSSARFSFSNVRKVSVEWCTTQFTREHLTGTRVWVNWSGWNKRKLSKLGGHLGGPIAKVSCRGLFAQCSGLLCSSIIPFGGPSLVLEELP